jgi:DNA-binding transcriptional LysR family regulator
MDFRELEYIVAIAKNQGIGQAAKECFITQPAMTKFIQNLEYNLGQPLFHRLGHKFLLTYAGERYVETAKTILETKKNLEQELSDIIKEDVGEIKVGFRDTGGINVIPEVLSAFWKQYPRIKIKIHENNSRTLLKELLNGDIDLAIIIFPSEVPPKHPDISTELISREEYILIMHKGHPLVGRGVAKANCKYPWMDITIMKDEPFILLEQGRIANSIFREAGIKPNVLLIVKNTEAMVQLAAKGFAVAFVGESALRYAPGWEKLHCFSVGNPNTLFSLAVAFRSEMYQPTYVKHFINIARDVFGAFLK